MLNSVGWQRAFIAPAPGKPFKIVEPTIGIEPMNLFLTKEALYRLSYVGFGWQQAKDGMAGWCSRPTLEAFDSMERETRLELATFSLEG